MKTYHKKTKQFLYQGLFDSVSSFEELEGRIEKLDSKQDKGDAFEVFAQAYLATQKIVQAKMVWAFDDIPQNVRSNISIDTHIDMGVDGAFEMNTGEQCAYQVKFRTGRPYLTWSELSTFMGLTEQADKRVLFTNCDDIPDLMNDRSDFYCVRGSDLDLLEVEDFSAIKAWLEGSKVKFKQYDPLPHQTKALQKIELAFKDADRATVVMACGTGKTLVQLWAAEMLNVKSVLVLVPSLALIRQTLHEWLRQTMWENFSYMCVCSDPSVAKGSDEVAVKQSELDFPVTTNSLDVLRYLNTVAQGPRMVFSTYQSARAVAEGMPCDFVFDLGLFDEAHKTAGRGGTKFAFALDDDNLRIGKRLFMTATPRHYDVSKKDKEGDSKVVYSMDVPELYGETAYSLSFRQAINNNLICDYKVLISVVTSEQIDDWQLSHGEVIVQGGVVKARQVANQIALRNAVEKYGVKRIFTFHSTVKSARLFTSSGGEGINSELPDFVAVHVNGAMSAAKRVHIMREFEHAKQAVISNARCLTEGVDVPAVDMVAFLSPKKSRVDIVQATGRAMRKSPAKKIGYVLVPLYLELQKGESIEAAVERSDFIEIWNVLQAMKEQDDMLTDIIERARKINDLTGEYDDERFSECVEVLGPALSLEVIRKFVTTRCLDNLRSYWDKRLGELIAYRNLHGDMIVQHKYPTYALATWLLRQRMLRKKGLLSKEKVKRLDELGFPWSGISYENKWNRRIKELLEYKSRYGDCNIPLAWSENPTLGRWVYSIQAKMKKGESKLKEDQINQLNEIGFNWERVAYKKDWDEMFLRLVEYKYLYGHCKVPEFWEDDPDLARWVRSQRDYKNTTTQGLEREKKLNKIGFYRRSGVRMDTYPRNYHRHTEGNLGKSDNEYWVARYEQLVDFKNIYGHCRVPDSWGENRRLASWVKEQRNELSVVNATNQAHREALNKIGFSWVPWEDMFEMLMGYKNKYGDCNVPYKWLSDPELATWVYRQRSDRRNGKISGEHIERLSNLGFAWSTQKVQDDKRKSC